MLKLKIEGTPVTKKNSQRIILIGGHPKIMPSKQYKEYEEMALRQLMAQPTPVAPISVPVTVSCTYWMPTHRRVDLVNLLEATDDILTRARIIQDDHAGIVASHDGSRVAYDKTNPRVEITIKEVQEGGRRPTKAEQTGGLPGCTSGPQNCENGGDKW